MTAEDLIIDDGGDGEAIETVGKCLPQFDRKPPLAFVVETVDPDKRQDMTRHKSRNDKT